MLASAWMVFALGVGLSQTPSGSSAANAKGAPGNAQKPSARIVVNGCINGAASRYTLMQRSTGAVFALLGPGAQLEQARSKLVEVRGEELPPAGGAGLKDLPRLKVSSVRVLSDKCPIETEMRRPAGKATSNGTGNPPSAATPEYGAPGAVNQTPPPVSNNPTTWNNGAQGAPSPGTGNTPPPAQSPPQ
jgi:hypothetical protein